MEIGSQKGLRGDINVTPLVDVVLVLLIIFMVLTPSTLKHLDATLPKKADETTAPPPTEAPILVEYTAKRELTINGEPVQPDALPAALAARLRDDRQKVVFFKAEDQAPYGDVVRLMDLARGSGARTLAVVTVK
ncbi:MAG TPA: biopolymer transporter ExbD [Polyangia bacterium]|jgi:biopolymer transport protein ExbD|nr:biopolymer transporter ExbD [Polyangia bacterium]